ncbi:MAG: hypothetical protein H0U59_02385 [Gemmatimonadaceae bacterium]|nr:hypothetical protein [Gemmatimonadaceae bacterium]
MRRISLKIAAVVIVLACRSTMTAAESNDPAATRVANQAKAVNITGVQGFGVAVIRTERSSTPGTDRPAAMKGI